MIMFSLFHTIHLCRYEREGPLRGSGAPVAAVLLYRKHVITEQPYIGQLITQMEAEGVIPLPIFINGVEAHTVVRGRLCRGGGGGRHPAAHLHQRSGGAHCGEGLCRGGGRRASSRCPSSSTEWRRTLW